MKKLILGLSILFSASLAQADVYLCKFSHRAQGQAKYSHKFSDIIFKNYQGTLHDDSGDLLVSIHYSSARNLVTQIVSEKKIHATFSDPRTEQLLAQKIVDQGKDLKVRSMNNWLIDCASIIHMPY